MRPLNKENDLQRLDQFAVSCLPLLCTPIFWVISGYMPLNLCYLLYYSIDVCCFCTQMDKLRPEFRAGLDALTKFVFERTRPKQLGATVMTGPILVGITESYLNALNNGAVPTISSSWQVGINY